MALKAGYVGVKRWLWDKLRNIVEALNDNNNVTGVRNILPNNLVDKTDQGVTFTRGADGVISLSGTAAANVDAAIYDTRDSGELWRGLTIIVSKGIENENIKILVNAYNDTTYVKTLVDLASGTESAPITFDYNGYNRVRVTAYVKSGTNTTGKKIYPMFRLASDPDDTYVPFAMTNQQLTKSVVKTTGVFDQVTANKSGYMVELSFTGTTITNEDGKTLGTLDAAYRPGTNINLYTKVYNGSSYVDAQVKVTASSGAVELLTLSGNAVTGAQVNFLLARPIFMSGSAAGVSRSVTPDERSLDVEVEEPEVVKKSTKKTTKKEVE